MRLKLQAIAFLVLSSLLFSCIEIPEGTGGPTAPTDPNAPLAVPEGFDFSMNYQQSVSLTATDDQGQPIERVQFYLHTAPPEEGVPSSTVA